MGEVRNDRSESRPDIVRVDDSRRNMIFDARGNGDGAVSPTITGDHQNRITDYTAIVLCFTKQRRAKSNSDFETWIESDVSNTLNAFDIGDVRSTTLVVKDDDKDKSAND